MDAGSRKTGQPRLTSDTHIADLYHSGQNRRFAPNLPRHHPSSIPVDPPTSRGCRFVRRERR